MASTEPTHTGPDYGPAYDPDYAEDADLGPPRGDRPLAPPQHHALTGYQRAVRHGALLLAIALSVWAFFWVPLWPLAFGAWILAALAVYSQSTGPEHRGTATTTVVEPPAWRPEDGTPPKTWEDER